MLLATALAYRGPVVAAPAMNPRMWAADATRANAEMLRRRGVELVGPATGDTAEGELGVGRMAEPEEIAGAIERRLAVAGQLAGRRVLVTAGGTREPLDAVRYIGNRSSGRMGVAVADEAARRGADVTLLLCAGAVAPETHVNVIAVETAEQLRAATVEHAAASDVVVMAAAVADYRPAAAEAGKRTKDGAAWSIELEPTADILAELGAARRDGAAADRLRRRARGGRRRARAGQARPQERRRDRRQRHQPQRHRLRRRRQRNRDRDVKAGNTNLPTAEARLRGGHPGLACHGSGTERGRRPYHTKDSHLSSSRPRGRTRGGSTRSP